MATDAQARADIVKLTARVVVLERDSLALQKEVSVLKDQNAFMKGQLNTIGNELDEQRNTDAMHDGQIADLDERVAVLEGYDTDYDYQPEPEPEPEPIPPDPGPDVPPPVAAFSTTVQGLEVTLEAADQGPTAAYDWKLGSSSGGGVEDTATGRVVEHTYPHESDRTVTLHVKTAAGSAEHAETFYVGATPPDGGGGTEPPDPVPPDPTKPDLFFLDLPNTPSPQALWEKYDKPAGAQYPNLFQGDAVFGQNLLLTTDDAGVKVQRHLFDRRGLSCKNDVSCQAGTKRWGNQQEVYTTLVFATSKNWLPYDPACDAQVPDKVGDMKLQFLDTTQDMSGRFAGCLSHNNATTQNPQGSNYQEGAPQSASATGAVQARDGWTAYTFQPGVKYRIDKHFKCSTTPSSNDGVNEEWVTNLVTGQRVKTWDDRGFSVCAAPDTTKPEFVNGTSICHNQSKGRHDAVMHIDIYELSAWSKSNPPTWATK